VKATRGMGGSIDEVGIVGVTGVELLGSAMMKRKIKNEEKRER
jgi:hypothetical protein